MVYMFKYYDPISSTYKYWAPSECPSFPFSHKVLDKPIKSKFQDGSTFQRPRFTKLRKKFTMKFDYLIDSEKLDLVFMEDTIMGVNSFEYYWDFPSTEAERDAGDNTIKVVFSDPINFELVLRTQTTAYWNVSFSIEEV